MIHFQSKNGERVLCDNYQIIEIVNKNTDYITKNFEKMQKYFTKNCVSMIIVHLQYLKVFLNKLCFQFQDVVQQALSEDLLCHKSPTWRPWL